MTDRERCQDIRTVIPADTSVGRADAATMAGRRQHSRRFGMAKRISRVAASWPGPIGALTVFWAVVLLRMKRAWRSGPVRLAHRLGRMLAPVPGRLGDPRAS